MPLRNSICLFPAYPHPPLMETTEKNEISVGGGEDKVGPEKNKTENVINLIGGRK